MTDAVNKKSRRFYLLLIAAVIILSVLLPQMLVIKAFAANTVSVVITPSSHDVTVSNGETVIITSGNYENITVSIISESNKTKISADGFGFNGTLVISGENAELKKMRFDGGSLEIKNCAAVSVEDVDFCESGSAISVSDSSDVTIRKAGFVNCDRALSAVNSCRISVKDCIFSNCRSGISADNTDFGYIATQGGYGEIKNCFFYDCAVPQLYGNCRDVSIRSGSVSAADTALTFTECQSILAESTVVYGCKKAVSLENTSGSASDMLFFSNEKCFDISGGENDFEIAKCVSVGCEILTDGKTANGVAVTDCTVTDGSGYNNCFAFENDGEAEGFTTTMAVRVAVENGCFSFEPEIDYLYINRKELYLNQYLFCRSAIKFASPVDFFGNINIKMTNDSPWIFSDDININYESEDGMLYTLKAVECASPVKNIQIFLSVVGRQQIDYIRFYPDITVLAELSEDNKVTVSLDGCSKAVFGKNYGGIAVGGCDIPYEVKIVSPQKAELIFEKSVVRNADKMTVTVSPETLAEPFSDLTSGKNLLGEPDGSDFVTELKCSVDVKGKNIKELVIHAAMYGGGAVVVAAAVFLLIKWIDSRNKIKKYAKKGKTAINKRKRARKF